MIKRWPVPDAASLIYRTDKAITKKALTKSGNQFA
jgi:hypothetical protein